MAKRLQFMGSERYRNGFKVTIHKDLFEAPLSWKKPSTIFVNSMSDLFHEDIPEETILKLFQVMRQASHHTFQILTKRAERLAQLANRIPWSRNIWIGVTVESEKYIERIEMLKTVPAEIRFISFEPLLSTIDESHSLIGIDWVIVGGESGPFAVLWMRNG
jgi:protein gp37